MTSMDKIRVLQVIPSLACGGAERMLVNLMTHLDLRRFEGAAAVLADPSDSVLEATLKKQQFQVWHLGKGSGLDLRVPYRIRTVIQRFRPHIVHSHLAMHYIDPCFLPPRIRHVNTLHLSGQLRYWALMKPLLRSGFRRGVLPVAVSREVAIWAEQAFGIENCTVIPNGIPIGHYEPSSGIRELWRKKEGFTDEHLLLVCVARLEKQKNHSMLLEALAKLRHTFHGVRLLLVGEGACRDELELQVRNLNLQETVRFLGRRSDVPHVLNASDIFVLPSHNEGNPLALMEAMAAGLPIIATAVGGVPELVEHPRTGLLVPAANLNAIVSAIRALLLDRSMREHMGRSAAHHARKFFSASLMTDSYMRLYEDLVPATVTMSQRASLNVTEICLPHPQ